MIRSATKSLYWPILSKGMLVFRKFGMRFLLLSMILSSCISHKKLLYLQGPNSKDSIVLDWDAYSIQNGDVLSIKVSSLDQESVAIFNKEIGGANTNLVNEAGVYLQSYIVSDSGTVQLPVVGTVNIVGLTLNEATIRLEEKLKGFYKHSSIDVKLMSFRVTVLGEVRGPGTIIVYNQKTNLLQALGMVGGLTDLADISKIRIIRQSGNQSKLNYIDISKTDIIASEFYFLKPNDIIYVEPLHIKALRINAPTVSILLSTLTFLIVLTNFLTR